MEARVRGARDGSVTSRPQPRHLNLKKTQANVGGSENGYKQLNTRDEIKTQIFARRPLSFKKSNNADTVVAKTRLSTRHAVRAFCKEMRDSQRDQAVHTKGSWITVHQVLVCQFSVQARILSCNPSARQGVLHTETELLIVLSLLTPMPLHSESHRCRKVSEK